MRPLERDSGMVKYTKSKLSHYEFSVKYLGKDHRGQCKCSAHDMTFGGRCLNCGYDPEVSAHQAPGGPA